MPIPVAFLVLVNVLALFYVSAQVLVAHLLGLRILEVSLGMLVELGRWQRQGVVLRLLLPIGGTSIRFGPREGETVDAIARLPPSKRLLLACSGHIPLVVLAVLTLGLTAAGRHLLAGPAHVFSGLSPSGATTYVERWAGLLRHGSLAAAFGVLATKFVAINLLPLPGFSGFDVLRSLLTSQRGVALRQWLETRAASLSILVMGVLGVGWARALWRWDL